jgi:hypothetical protein
MKLSQVLQSVLLGLILLGLFATMAQNSYGLTLMGVSCFGLALLFLVQLSWKVIEDSGFEKKDITMLSELLLLSLLLLVFGFRIFYIKLPFSDIIFLIICVLLVLTYISINLNIYKRTRNDNPSLARNSAYFYSSIIIFLISLGSRIIAPSLSSLIGALGFIVAIPFLISLFGRKQYDYSERSVTIFQFIASTGNKSGMLFLFFMLSSIYIGLSNFRIIPNIGNADKPPTYIELVNNAEAGKEKPVNGKFQHEIYKENMDKFLLRHGRKQVRK